MIDWYNHIYPIEIDALERHAGNLGFAGDTFYWDTEKPRHLKWTLKEEHETGEWDYYDKGYESYVFLHYYEAFEHRREPF